MLSTQERGLSPTVYSFGSTIAACEKCGQWQKAVELLRSMPRFGVKPNTVVYSSAVSNVYV